MLAALIGVVASTINQTATASTVVSVVANADAYTDSANPATGGRGAGTNLYVDGAPSLMSTYLRFDLSAFAGQTVVSASLKVRTQTVSSAGSTQSQDIRPVADDAWTESGLTYNTRPAVGASIGVLSSTVANTVYTRPLTASAVQAQLGGQMSLAVDAPSASADGLSLMSREVTTAADRPTLVVNLEASSLTTSPSPSPTPTVTQPPTASVTKLLVFMEENHSLSQMQAGMPYTAGLAKQYGYATGYTAITHPSLPNYIAIAGGQTYGITDDNGPSSHPLNGSSVFGQAVAAGKSAKIYAEGMTSNCLASNTGRYVVKHNPWPYFTPATERTPCASYDVPETQFGTDAAAGTLPNIGMVVPDLCNDAHDCSLSVADSWFQARMQKIFAGPDWQSGHLAVVLTADEDDRSQGNKVLTVVIHPSQSGNVVSTPLTHYSLTRLYADVAGTPYLHNAATAASMSTAFGLPLAASPTPTQSPTPTGSTTVDVVAGADDYVDSTSTNASANFGTSLNLYADGGPSLITTYMKFDLTPYAGKVVTSAQLTVRTTTGTSSGSTDTQVIHGVADDSWTETGLTYNNRPAVGAQIGTLGPTVVNTTYTRLLDTAATQSQLGQQMSVAIDQSSVDGLTLNSRQVTTSADRPTLTLTFAP